MQEQKVLTSVDDVLAEVAQIRKQLADGDPGTTDKQRLAGELKKAQDQINELQKQFFDQSAPRGGFDMPKDSPLLKSATVRRGGLRFLVDNPKKGRMIYKRFPKESIEKRLQDWNDDVLIAAAALRMKPKEVLKTIPEFNQILAAEIGVAESELEKALAAATAGSGADWVPEIFSPELNEQIRLERVLLRTFRQFPMRHSPMRLPQLIADMRSYVVSESTTDVQFQTFTASEFGTANLLLEAIKIVSASRMSDEFEEESIIPAIPAIRDNIRVSQSGSWEDAIINGSTTVPHPDGGVGANDPATGFDGMRAEALGSDFSGTQALVTLSNPPLYNELVNMTKRQGRFGTVPGESMWLTSPQGIAEVAKAKDDSGEQIFAGADKFGAQAVLFTGAIGRMLGRDVILSDFVKTTHDAGGAVPTTPGDRTLLILYNRRSSIFADRRSLLIESDRVIGTGQVLFVASQRGVWRRVKPSRDAVRDNPIVIGVGLIAT